MRNLLNEEAKPYSFIFYSRLVRTDIRLAGLFFSKGKKVILIWDIENALFEID